MLSSAQVSEKLNAAGIKMSSDQVARLANEGKFPEATKNGNRWVIPPEAVDRFIAQQNMHKKRRNKWWIIFSTLLGALALIAPFTGVIADVIGGVADGLSVWDRSGATYPTPTVTAPVLLGTVIEPMLTSATPTRQVATSTPTPLLPTYTPQPAGGVTNNSVSNSGTINCAVIGGGTVNCSDPLALPLLATSQAREIEAEQTKNAESTRVAQEATKAADASAAQKTAEAKSESQRLASESQSVRTNDPETAILIALKANEYAHTFEAENALRDALNTPYAYSGMSLPMEQNLVKDFAFSPNGTLLVTAGTEDTGGLAKVWELDTGRLIATLHDRVDYLLTAKFLDDDRILTYSATGNMLIWDARTGQQIGNFRPKAAINDLFVPRSDRLVEHRRFNQDNTAVTDRFDVYVGIYDTASGTLVYSISPPQNHTILDVRYEDGTATVLLRDDVTPVLSIGSYQFANSAEPQLRQLEDLNANQAKITLGLISQSGKLAAYGDSQGGIKIFDVTSGRKVQELREHDDEILSLNFSLDERWLVSSSKDRTTKVWDISSTANSLLTVSTDEPLGYVVIAPNKRWFGGVRNKGALLGGDIQVWNVNTVVAQSSGSKIPKGYQPGGFINGGNGFVLKPAPLAGELPVLVKQIDGSEVYELPASYVQYPQNQLLTSIDATQFYLYSLQAGSLTGLDQYTGDITTFSERPIGENAKAAVVFSPDLKVALEPDGNDSLQVWDVANGTKSGLLPNAYIDKFHAWSADSTYLVTVKSLLDTDFGFDVWNVKSGSKVAELKTPDGLAFRAVFSPDNRLLAGTSADMKLRIWDWQAGNLLLTIDTLMAPPTMARLDTMVDFVNSFEFSQDSTKILIADNSSSANLFAIATGNIILTFVGHSDNVTKASFSPDGMQVVTTSLDGTVRLWDSATAKETTRFNDLDYAEFSPNGRYLVGWNEEGGGEVYFVHLDDLIQQAKHRVTRELSCSERVQYLHESVNCSP